MAKDGKGNGGLTDREAEFLARMKKAAPPAAPAAAAPAASSPSAPSAPAATAPKLASVTPIVTEPPMAAAKAEPAPLDPALILELARTEAELRRKHGRKRTIAILCAIIGACLAWSLVVLARTFLH
jgi:hypothetical protein